MTSPLRGRAPFFYVLTVLSFVGTVAGFALLLTATTRVCDSISCRNVTVASDLAWYVLVGGIVQTVLLLTIGQLCSTVTRLVERAN